MLLNFNTLTVPKPGPARRSMRITQSKSASPSVNPLPLAPPPMLSVESWTAGIPNPSVVPGAFPGARFVVTAPRNVIDDPKLTDDRGTSTFSTLCFFD